MCLINSKIQTPYAIDKRCMICGCVFAGIQDNQSILSVSSSAEFISILDSLVQDCISTSIQALDIRTATKMMRVCFLDCAASQVASFRFNTHSQCDQVQVQNCPKEKGKAVYPFASYNGIISYTSINVSSCSVVSYGCCGRFGAVNNNGKVKFHQGRLCNGPFAICARVPNCQVTIEKCNYIDVFAESSILASFEDTTTMRDAILIRCKALSCGSNREGGQCCIYNITLDNDIPIGSGVVYDNVLPKQAGPTTFDISGYSIGECGGHTHHVHAKKSNLIAVLASAILN